VTLLAVTFAEPVIRLTAGPEYTPVASWAWAFALLGVVTALLQLFLYAGLATAARRMSVLLWLAAAVEILAVTLFFHGSIAQIVVTGLLTAAGLLCVAIYLERTHQDGSSS